MMWAEFMIGVRHGVRDALVMIALIAALALGAIVGTVLLMGAL